MISEKRINVTLIKLIDGDITKCQVEAIVNAANNRLWMGGGVAGAIKRAGGRVIEEEAMRQGPIPIGSAVVTGAGSLPAKYVIHAAVMGQDLITNANFIRQATRASLEFCRERKIKSVAFPALGTGVGGFPFEEAAKIMLKEVSEFARVYTGLEMVIFALFGKEAFQAFCQELEKI